MPALKPKAPVIRDFHLHTRYSDGVYTPEELVKGARDQGVIELAVTDHNIVSGLPEGERAAKEAGVAFLSGVELSAWYEGREVHILGYGFDPERLGSRSPLARYMDELQRHQRLWLSEVAARSRERPIRLDTGTGVKREIFITEEDTGRFSRSFPNGFHLGVLVKEKLDEACEGFREVPARHVFYFLFWRNEPAYLARYEQLFAKHGIENRRYWDVDNVRPPFRPAEEAIPVLRGEGALPVIAHPAEMRIGEGELGELASYGLGGIEVYTPKHGPPQVALYERLASKHGLLKVSGTDYHDPFWRRKTDFGRDRDGNPLTSGAAREDILGAALSASPSWRTEG